MFPAPGRHPVRPDPPRGGGECALADAGGADGDSARAKAGRGVHLPPRLEAGDPGRGGPVRALHLLHVEDVEEDALRVERDLQGRGWEVRSARVDTAEALREALHRPWDIIVCGHAVPGLVALQALEIVRASEHPDTPFIVVSGSMGEEATIEILRRGASDFINKRTLARLAPAITRELADAQVRR